MTKKRRLWLWIPLGCVGSVLVIAGILFFTIVGVGSCLASQENPPAPIVVMPSEEETSSLSEPETTTTTPSDLGTIEPPFPLGASITLEDVQVTITKHEIANSYTTDLGEKGEPEPGAKFLWIYVTSKNIGEVEKELPTQFAFSLLYKDTEIQPRTWWGSINGRKMYADGKMFVYPGYGNEGWIFYEVPERANPEEILIKLYPHYVSEELRNQVGAYYWKLQ